MLKNYFKWFLFLYKLWIWWFCCIKQNCIKAYENVWEVDPQEVMSSFSSAPLRWLVFLRIRQSCIYVNSILLVPVLEKHTTCMRYYIRKAAKC